MNHKTSCRLFSALLLMAFLPAAVSFVGKQSTIPKRLSMVVSSFDLTSSSRSLSSGKEILDPLIICGPSGVGKGSIIDIFMNQHNGRERFGFSVSHTTRQPRPGEQDGVHYHFVAQSEFDNVGCSKFVEWAQVHGNFYGTSWDSLKSVQLQGKRALLDIDVQGVQRLKDQDEAFDTLFLPRFVFIAPPSLETLQERLIARGTESAESLQRRLANAKAEVDYGLAPGNFDAIIVNDDLLRAARELSDTIEDLYDK